MAAYLTELDDFIEREITPLEQQDDNIRFFDHRRALAGSEGALWPMLTGRSPRSDPPGSAAG
jgi:hypothetical protein